MLKGVDQFQTGVAEVEVEGWKERTWGENFLITLSAVAMTGRHMRISYFGMTFTRTAPRRRSSQC